MTPTTIETRVLEVFEPGVWFWQADVLTTAGMDVSTCIATLRRLVAAGLLEFKRIERQGVRGRRRHAYRLAMRGAVAA